MNEIKIFKNDQFGEVRVSELNGEPLFCLADVCKALDLSNPSMVAGRLSKKGISNTDTPTSGGIQSMIYINEGNLYKCIFQSRKADAEKFQDWVCEEVLPAIRKTGGYIATSESDTPELIMARALLVAQDTISRHKEQLKLLEEKNALLLHQSKLYTTTEIAKELNMKSASYLNNLLSGMDIQFKQNNTWILYSKYADKGYVSIKQDILDNGRIIYDRKWTGIGRSFLLELFKLN